MKITLLIAAGGALLVTLASSVLGLPGADSFQLATIALAAAGAVGAVGVWTLHAARSRSIAAQSMIVALTALVAVAAGAALAARAMFISTHDLSALIVVLVAGGAAGVLLAFLLGARIGSASEDLGSTARSIGEGGYTPMDRRPATRELNALARELEEMSAKLEATRKREHALENSRRELVAWVSHDLRTPLAGIRAITEALDDGVVTEPEVIQRYYRTLRTEADRLAGLVDDLFELSRVTAGNLRFQMERASLSDLISDALAAATPLAKAKGVHVEGRMEGEAPEIDLSTPEMARVFRNLLENAIRHTPSDKTILVEAGVRDGHAEVSVEDSCGGIPPSDLGRVFDPAFRGEAARTPGGQGGTGLGLAIARGIVEAHHGQIEVANRGEGCRFTVKLPLPQPGATGS